MNQEIQSNFISNSFRDVESSRDESSTFEQEEKMQKDNSDVELNSHISPSMPDSQHLYINQALSDVTFHNAVSDVLSCTQTYCNGIENVSNNDSSSSLENSDSASTSIESGLRVSSKYQSDSGIGSESNDFSANFSITPETVLTPVSKDTEMADSSLFPEVESSDNTTIPISKEDNQQVFLPLSPVGDIYDSNETSGQLLTRMMKETLKAITEKLPPENTEFLIERRLSQETDEVEEASYPSTVKPKWTNDEEQSDMKIASVAERDNLPSSPCERSKLILRIKKTYSSIICPPKNPFSLISSERQFAIEKRSCCHHAENRSSHSHHKNRYKKKRSKHKTHKHHRHHHHHRRSDDHRNKILKRKFSEPSDVSPCVKSPNNHVKGEKFSEFLQRVGEVKYKRIKLKYGNNMSLNIDIPPSKHKKVS